MNDTESDPQPIPVDPMVAQGLPQHTTPTWEVELLISGIAVFAMLQLPGWLDDRYFDLAPRFDADWQFVIFSGFVYSRIAALILAVTFVLHLLLRAHWIALVGLDSVYPNGIRWDRVRMGALQREVSHECLGTMAEAIERADNRATIVFAAGVYLAMQALKLVAMIAISTCLFYVLSLFMDTGRSGSFIMLLIAAAIVPIFVAWLIDRHIGHRLAAGGRATRILGAIIRGYSKAGFGRGSTPGLLLISSNQGQRLSFVVSVLVITAAVGSTMYQVEVGRNPNQIGNYGLLPTNARDAADVLRPDHYDDQRDNQRLGTTPFIQSQVVADPYLRLMIPFNPKVHNAALLSDCAVVGHAFQSKDDARQRRALLDCFSTIHPLQLDSQALQGIRYDLGTDPKAHRPALVAMIDVRALANGRHELLVGEPAQPNLGPTPSDRIPFWR